MLGHLYIVLKLEIRRGSAGRIGKSSSAKVRIYTNACVFRVDTSNAYISISIFARQGPFSQVRSHIDTSLIPGLYKLFNFSSHQRLKWLQH